MRVVFYYAFLCAFRWAKVQQIKLSKKNRCSQIVTLLLNSAVNAYLLTVVSAFVLFFPLFFIHFGYWTSCAGLAGTLCCKGFLQNILKFKAIKAAVIWLVGQLAAVYFCTVDDANGNKRTKKHSNIKQSTVCKRNRFSPITCLRKETIKNYKRINKARWKQQLKTPWSVY